jgi:hypothetical protein
MTASTTTTLLAVCAAALITAGCGGSSQESTGSTPASGAPSSTAAPELSDQQAPPEQVTLDVTIKDGQVTPTNAQLEARLGEPIVIRVNSDAADELHVHSNPEHSFAVAPANGQSFQFTVDVPGRVDVELHEQHVTVATISVAQ